MQKSLIWLVRILPLWLMYGVMAFVIPFYVAFNRRGRRASWSYFRYRMGYPAIKSAVSVYANMFNLGMVVLDRFAVYAGKKFNVDIQDAQSFTNYSNDEDGFVILSCHVGNHEMTGYSLRSVKHMNVLVYAGETETVMRNRERIFGDSNVSMVPVREDLSHLFELNAALSRGEIVSLPADRFFGAQKTVTARIFGADAKFPAGPFKLAVSMHARVITIMCVKTGLHSYKMITRPLEADSVQSLAQNFALEVEKVVKQWPHQWYNFYDFWA